MRKLLPDSVAGRIVLVMLVGLTLSHLVSMAIYYTEGTEASTLLGDRHVAQRIAMITRLVEETPRADRERILKALDSGDVRVVWSERGAGPQAIGAPAHPHPMAHMLRTYLGDRGEGGLHVALGERWGGDRPEAMRRHMQAAMADPAGSGQLWASVRLADSTWLSFRAPLDRSTPFWSLRFVLSMSIMVLAVLALSIWVVRRTTAPLAAFARAAERLGVDVSAPALPESGPREVRQAARAFNQMQTRVRRFVEDRTQMVAAIAHDLRTPITRLRLHAEFVEEEEQRRKMLADLDEMERMIASTLSFAREDAATEARETVDLVTLIQSVCDDMADAGHEVEFSSEEGLAYACRRVALRRAFTNLVENAVKYGQRARISLDVEADELMIRIDDDGPGIPDEMLDEVFKPFRRLESSRSRETGGTGLGLTVARTIIHAHGGKVALGTRAGGGLRVEVTLPRGEKGDAAAPAEPESARATERSR